MNQTLNYLLLAVGIIFLSVGAVGLATGKFSGSFELSQQGFAYEPKVSGTTSEGDVAIEIQPTFVRDGVITADMSVNTHSVDLSPFDLKESITLEYNGKKAKPTNVPTLSGHHSGGQLIFNIGETPKKFSITLKGVPLTQLRRFEW